jgi:hypothetical protein
MTYTVLAKLLRVEVFRVHEMLGDDIGFAVVAPIAEVGK